MYGCCKYNNTIIKFTLFTNVSGQLEMNEIRQVRSVYHQWFWSVDRRGFHHLLVKIWLLSGRDCSLLPVRWNLRLQWRTELVAINAKRNVYYRNNLTVIVSNNYVQPRRSVWIGHRRSIGRMIRIHRSALLHLWPRHVVARTHRISIVKLPGRKITKKSNRQC